MPRGINAQTGFCDHGATSFTDPRVTIPEAARVLRGGGLLAFNIASPFIEVFWGDDDAPPTDRLRRSYFGPAARSIRTATA